MKSFTINPRVAGCILATLLLSKLRHPMVVKSLSCGRFRSQSPAKDCSIPQHSIAWEHVRTVVNRCKSCGKQRHSKPTFECKNTKHINLYARDSKRRAGGFDTWHKIYSEFYFQNPRFWLRSWNFHDWRCMVPRTNRDRLRRREKELSW